LAKKAAAVEPAGPPPITRTSGEDMGSIFAIFSKLRDTRYDNKTFKK
jgi:hypothetical protein